MKYISVLILFFFVITDAKSQEKSPTVRISGMVIDADSLNPVSFTSITIKHSTRGTVSDNSGYFSIFAYELDTLEFSNVGYETSHFVVPPNLPTENYGLVHAMSRDTLVLEELVIFPWPSAEEFEQAFLSLEVQPDRQTRSQRSKKNIQMALDQQLAREKFYYDQMRYNRFYQITGDIPPNNFLNPITWSNFIRDWKNGEFETDEVYLPKTDR